ncbi:MAG TPA: heparinase II/III family protein [Paludibacteraceae bacterium]|nr:heparinase II/III family protein [Paludibacteraceae bacterium]HPT43390.1 heparinase II/III family protein [Paludibacteraceae bacterium]
MKRIYTPLLILLTVQTYMFPFNRDLLAKSATVDNLTKILIPDRKWVPYPAYSDRGGWDQLTAENKTVLIKRGEKQLGYEWKVIKATDYLEYERSGDRNVMQNPNSANINALADLVLAELAEGKGRFLNQIINGVFYQCERTSWVLSAHLPLQLTGRTLPEHTDVVIDLGSGDFGSFLAWTYYFLHTEFDKVNPVISKRLHDELYNKIILPYRKEDRYWWMGFKPRQDGLVNNWNPWINCNVLQCIALLEDDQTQYAKDVYKTMLSVDKFINYVKEDGACEEGPSYWAHAAGKLYDYLEVLSWITNNKITLFENRMIKDMGEYISKSYVGNDWVVNFADASARFSSDAGLIFRYGKAINSSQMQQFASYLVHKQGKKALADDSDLSDMFRKLESLKYYQELMNAPSMLSTSEVTAYPKTQFYYLRNKNNLFAAIKGGYNAESHNHNDAGTFSLWLDGMPVFIDAGVGTYTRQTFGAERYSIWTMRSGYHNLPDINGQEQRFGKDFKAGNIVFDAVKKSVSLDIAKAYSDSAAVQSWTRKYQLNDNELEITDKYNLKAAIYPNEIHFLVWGKLVKSDGKLLVDAGNRKMELQYDKNQFTSRTDTIALSDVRLSKVWGNEIYRFTLTSKSKNKTGTYKYIIRKMK